MTDPDTDFDELPEPLRLALLEHAREQLRDRAGRIRPVPPRRLADAAGANPAEFHRVARIAMLKLQSQAAELDLDLSDFL